MRRCGQEHTAAEGYYLSDTSLERCRQVAIASNFVASRMRSSGPAAGAGEVASGHASSVDTGAGEVSAVKQTRMLEEASRRRSPRADCRRK